MIGGEVKTLYLATGIASFLAIIPLPYGYYELLRWLVTVACIAMWFQAVEEGKRAWFLLIIPALALWNPFFGATMARSEWLLLNIAAGIAFLAASRSDSLHR